MSGKPFYMFDSQKTFRVLEMFSVHSTVVMFGWEFFFSFVLVWLFVILPFTSLFLGSLMSRLQRQRQRIQWLCKRVLFFFIHFFAILLKTTM